VRRARGWRKGTTAGGARMLLGKCDGTTSGRQEDSGLTIRQAHG